VNDERLDPRIREFFKHAAQSLVQVPSLTEGSRYEAVYSSWEDLVQERSNKMKKMEAEAKKTPQTGTWNTSKEVTRPILSNLGPRKLA